MPLHYRLDFKINQSINQPVSQSVVYLKGQCAIFNLEKYVTYLSTNKYNKEILPFVVMYNIVVTVANVSKTP
jgi:hypothetical protein